MGPHLTPRLEAVAQWVPRGARLADVGTDHGYLPTWLLLRNKIPSAIATDLRAQPLSKAAEAVSKWCVEDRVDLRLCDGLSAVSPEETDAVTVAGMGGETILEILSASPWALDKTCIVQPMSAAEDLRAGLHALGGVIRRERLVREGRTLYIMMELGRGGEALTPAECWAGKPSSFQDDPLWSEHFARCRRRAERALAGLERSTRPEDAPRRDSLREILAGLDTFPRE